MRRILSAFTIAMLSVSCGDHRAVVAEPNGSSAPQPPIHGSGDGDVFSQPVQPIEGDGPPATSSGDGGMVAGAGGSQGSGGGSGGSNPPAAAVPEPGTMLLVGSGLAAAAYAAPVASPCLRRRRA